jgi:hypothetical protein
LKQFVSLFCFIILIGGLKSYSQVKNYTFSESVTSYSTLSSSTAIFAQPWTDAISPAIALPFTFNYDGVNYTQCRVSTNGFITFGTTAPLATTYLPLSAITGYAGAISVFGADLDSAGADLVYGEEGTAPNRVFVVQWSNVTVKNFLQNLNFQIRLSETSNSITLSYGSSSSTYTTLGYSQVGLRGPSNDFAQGNINNRFTNLTNGTWFNNTTVGTLNTSRIYTSTLVYPNPGLNYTWNPVPACTTPTAQPTALVLGATSITHNSIVGNSFTAASPAPTNYLVLRSTVNTPPTAAQIPNRTFPVLGGTMGAGVYTVVSISSATTFTQTGLTPDTTYYYWVIPYNGTCAGAPFYNLTGIISGTVTTCSAATVAAAATNVTGNDFTANWSAVAGATNYRIDVATNTTFLSLVPGYSNLSLGTSTSASITGLTPLTTYYYRVRAIGSGCVANSNTITVATVCGGYAIPYLQNFDTTAIGALPSCYTRVDSNSDAVQWGVNSIIAASAPKSMHITKNAVTAMNDWFFTAGLNLTGGTSYRLFFRYATGSSPTTTENLKVFLGSTATVGAMTQTLLDLNAINNTSFKSTFVDFTPAITGIYYVGYQGFSSADQSYIAIDDIRVTVSPSCFEPVDVTASAISATTATITFVPPSPDPSGGFEYYLSTSATAPILATVPTGSVGAGTYAISLSGLLASTSYYIWVRGNCGSADKSVWSLEESFSTECITPVITNAIPATRCGYGSVALAATPNTGSIINWYDTLGGNNLIATGNTFTTPNLSATTVYYAEAKAQGAIAKTGAVSPTAQGGTIAVQNQPYTIFFTVNSNTTLLSFDIFPYVSGQNGQLIVRNSSNVTLATYPYTTTAVGGATLQSLPIGLSLTPGNYSVFMSVLPASGLAMNTTNAIYPYTTSVASISGNSLDAVHYLGLYNWKFTTECLSTRIPIEATVTAPPALSLSATSTTICENTTSGLVFVSGYSAYDTFVWSPSTGVTGSPSTGYAFNPTTTTNYSLLASQSSGTACSNLLTYVVTVAPAPPPVMVVPAAVVTCQNSIQVLNGSAGSSYAVPVLSQDFNGPTIDWTAANTSVVGNTAASQWTLRQSPYNYASLYWNVTLNSNDASQFYFANADPQGPGSLTNTTLTSPSFSLDGATTAVLSFWHYINYIYGDSFLVQVSTNDGASWTTVKQYLATQGTPSGFVNSTVNLSAYLGSPNVKLRYSFVSNWAYGWAIDNVTVSATLALALSWSPVTDLYTDALATIPYTAGNPVTAVYVKPTATRTYMATSTGPNGCTTSATSVVTVDALPVGGTLSGSQFFCSAAAPSNIILSGHFGNILRWEYADDAAFTVNLTTINTTTTTLTSAQMGVITGVRYFRAVVKNGVCAQVYSTVTSVGFPSTTWDGTAWSNGVPTSIHKVIFTGNYSSTGTIDACSVTVTSGNVVINSGHTLSVQNTVTVTSGTLTINTNGSLYQPTNVANSAGVFSGGNSGVITYKRTTTLVRQFDFTYWSTPVNTQSYQTLLAFSPGTSPSKFFQFSGTAWVAVPPATTYMTVGKGYIIRTPDIAPFTSGPSYFNGSFVGVPNSGTITTPVFGGNQMNLLGNPYPSALSANAFINGNPNLNGTIYLWTHNTPYASGVYSSNDYATYNLTGSTVTAAAASSAGFNTSLPNGKIASGQGFFIKGLTAGVATFTNSMRVVPSGPNDNNQFFRINTTTPDSPVDAHRYWLDVFNAGGAFKQLLVGYLPEATNGIDRAFDGDMVNGGGVVALYSMVDAKKLSIQGRALPFDVNDIIPLGFSSTIAGSYTIKLSNFDGLFQSQAIYLEDTTLNIMHDLKAADYTFVTASGTFESRFKIHYNSTTLGIGTPSFTTSTVIIYKNNGTFTINSGTTTMAAVKVFDIQGRLLLDRKNINATETSFALSAANEVLLVQITSVDGVVVTKKVVQ